MGKSLLSLSQVTSTTAHVILGPTNLLADLAGPQDHLRPLLGGRHRPPAVGPRLLALESFGDPWASTSTTAPSTVPTFLIGESPGASLQTTVLSTLSIGLPPFSLSVTLSLMNDVIVSPLGGPLTSLETPPEIGLYYTTPATGSRTGLSTQSRPLLVPLTLTLNRTQGIFFGFPRLELG